MNFFERLALSSGPIGLPAVGASKILEAVKGQYTKEPGSSISGLTYNSPVYKPDYGTTVATEETPVPKAQGTTTAPIQTAPTYQSNYNGSSQMSDEDVANLSSQINSALNNGGVFGYNAGGSAMQVAKQLQAQRANEKASRTGLYAIDPNMAFSPDQIRQQTKAADDFYNEQIAGYAEQAQNELAKSASTSKYSDDSIFTGLSPNAVSLLTTLRKDFSAEPDVKKFNVIQNSAVQAKQLVDRLTKSKSAGTGADDLRLVFLFAKAQDPDSVVRETEYDNAKKMISTLPEGAKQAVSRVINLTNDGRGIMPTQARGFLTPEARKEVLNALIEQYNGSQQLYDNVYNNYAQMAENFSGRPGIGKDILVGYDKAFDATGSGYNTTGPKATTNQDGEINWENLANLQ